MSNHLIKHGRFAWLAAGVFTVAFAAVPVTAQDAASVDIVEDAVKPEAIDDGVVSLKFAFDGMPWRDVIKWFADTADLALHVGDVPTGSFTYSDPDSFTPDEALDRLNLFLLPQGFTLVRSGKLLSVINLSDPRSLQQLDSLAKFVTIEELHLARDNDVVKCIFALGELDAEDAVD
jgi:hypothetical protein